MAEDQEGPKIHVDSDWKAEAQREKQKLADKAKQASPQAGGGGGSAGAAPGEAAGAAAEGAGASGGEGEGGRGQMPPPTFETLLSTMATQALFAMGAIPDPRTGQRTAQLDLARHHIDMLAVIEDKTKGNLSDEESQLLSTTLHELRTHYVQIASSAAAKGGGPAGASAEEGK